MKILQTKVFIIVLWVVFKSYIEAWFVVYVFRIEPPIEINSEITTGYAGGRDSLIGNGDINQDRETPLLNNNPICSVIKA